ncbi:CatA-like O-acetyltransferase [Candidatus Uabimicrobium sp. HlEnr_7]|uniref:CatA-like O-acetyltransferase n=1 Tax=Candidatus Uabimicrobium helgolandensis TaxID=3095367 RepID=UPI0035564259
MKYLDIENWARKDQYFFFKEYENPFFNICTTLDIKNLIVYTKANKISLSHAYLYLSQKAVNETPEMRYRIQGNNVVVYDRIDAGWIMMKNDGSINFCYLKHTEGFSAFHQQMQKVSSKLETMPFDTNEDRDDLVYYSVLPWIHFRSLSHAHRMPRTDSVPRIVFGKCEEQNDKVNMPISIEVNHALMDGFHVAQFLDKFQYFLDNSKEILEF